MRVAASNHQTTGGAPALCTTSLTRGNTQPNPTPDIVYQYNLFLSHFELRRPPHPLYRLVEAVSELEDLQGLGPLHVLDAAVEALAKGQALQVLREDRPLDLLVEVGTEMEHLCSTKKNMTMTMTW